MDWSAIEDPMSAILKSLGFRKRSHSWRLIQPETVLVVNLQRSAFGPTCYLNLGVFLRALGPDTTPSEHHCHIRTRLDQLVEEPSTLLAALDLDSRLMTEQRLSILREHILGSALPWLQARETEEKARKALTAEQKPTGLVTLLAKERLGIAGAP